MTSPHGGAMYSWHPATIHCFLWAVTRGGPGRRADRGDGAFVRKGRDGTEGSGYAT